MSPSAPAAAPPRDGTGRGLLIAAPSSGAGKTTVTLGLLRALRDAGHAARGAKSGPDYIDPRFHEAATGRPCPNLDAWAMDAATLRGLAAGPGLCVVEGAMGLFDGAAIRSPRPVVSMERPSPADEPLTRSPPGAPVRAGRGSGAGAPRPSRASRGLGATRPHAPRR